MKQRQLILLAAALLIPSIASADPAPEPERTVIYIQPMGKELPARDMQYTVEALRTFYARPVKLLEVFLGAHDPTQLNRQGLAAPSSPRSYPPLTSGPPRRTTRNT